MYFYFGIFQEDGNFVSWNGLSKYTDHTLNSDTVDEIRKKLQIYAKLEVLDMYIYKGWPDFKKETEFQIHLSDLNKSGDASIVVVLIDPGYTGFAIKTFLERYEIGYHFFNGEYRLTKQFKFQNEDAQIILQQISTDVFLTINKTKLDGMFYPELQAKKRFETFASLLAEIKRYI
jgi:cell division protein YceG involved in septum cleavage